MIILLSEFNLILFECSQLLIFLSSVVRISDVSSLNLHVMLLSSTKRVNLKKAEQFGNSFIEMRNNKEARIESCGTPQSIE